MHGKGSQQLRTYEMNSKIIKSNSVLIFSIHPTNASEHCSAWFHKSPNIILQITSFYFLNMPKFRILFNLFIVKDRLKLT